MSNDFYNHNDGIPATLTRGASTAIRSEFELVQAGFDKLPTLLQAFSGSSNFIVAGGSADAWTASVAPTVLTSYTDGLALRVKFGVANTLTTPTLNLNGLGATQIVSEQGGALNAGDIAAGEIATLVYNATFGKFQITLGNSVASAQASAALATTQAGNATTQVGLATAQVALATTQAALATTQATAAAASATTAGTYAAAAATGAKFFNTIALGNAGVADAATFGVIAGGSDALVRASIYRRESAGVSTLLYAVLPAAEFDVQSAIESDIRLRGTAPNLYNAATVNDAFLPQKSDGALAANAGFYATDYIPVYPGQQIVCNFAQFSHASYGGPVFYNAKKQFVSAGTGVSGGTPVTVPASAAFVRIGFQNSAGSKSLLYVASAGSLPSAYGGFGSVDPAKAKSLIAQGVAELVGDNAVLNLFDPNAINTTGAFNVSTANVDAIAGYFTTGYMPVIPGGQVVANNIVNMSFPYGLGFYDYNKNYISGVAGVIAANAAQTVPANASYARYSFQNVTTSRANLVIVQGSAVPASYKSYGTVDQLQALVASRAAVGDYAPITSINLFDRRRAIAGQVVDTSNTVSSNASFALSDYMPVTPGGNVVTSVSQTGQGLAGNFGINFYDRNKSFLSAASGGGMTAGVAVAVPASAFYARTTVPNTILKTWTLYDGSTAPASPTGPVNLDSDDLIAIVKRWKGKNFGCAGDSITAVANSGVWPGLVAGYMGANMSLNTAVSSQTMSQVTSAQITSAGQLTNIDVLVVFIGTNDYSGGTALGSYADTSASATFYGYTRKAIETILGYKPTIRLVLFTPTPRLNMNNLNGVGLKLVDYANAIKAVCPDYSVPVLDLYSVSGLNSFNFSTYTADGLHPTATGEDLCIAKPARAFLESL